jgi:hypothetical protein
MPVRGTNQGKNTRVLTFSSWSEFVTLTSVVRDCSMLDCRCLSTCSSSRFVPIASDGGRITQHEANNTVIYWGVMCDSPHKVCVMCRWHVSLDLSRF